MGVNTKNAQDNIQPKGNKKPLQVLHISKKDTQKIDNEQTNSQEDIKKENIAIKPQIIKNDSVKEIENSNENNKDFDISQPLDDYYYYKNNFQSIRFTGKIARSEAMKYLHFFDVCLSPWDKNEIFQEKSARKTFEYLRAGKPIIVSNVIGKEKFLQNNSIWVG